MALPYVARGILPWLVSAVVAAAASTDSALAAQPDDAASVAASPIATAATTAAQPEDAAGASARDLETHTGDVPFQPWSSDSNSKEKDNGYGWDTDLGKRSEPRDSPPTNPTVQPPGTTQNWGFLGNLDPRNRAIVIGVTSGVAGSAVIGGATVGIMAAVQNGAKNKKWAKEHPGVPMPKMQHKTSGAADDVAAPAAPALPVAPTTTALPAVRATAPPKLAATNDGGDQIPMVVWIGLAALVTLCVCASCLATIVACFHSGSGKKAAKRSTRSRGMKEDPSRSRSMSSSVGFEDENRSYSQYSQVSNETLQQSLWEPPTRTAPAFDIGQTAVVLQPEYDAYSGSYSYDPAASPYAANPYAYAGYY